ncbi:MAG: radical SAM protein [Spirochaetota bacterium]|nr:radical SAM protein [Spirochaetota bacterium]
MNKKSLKYCFGPVQSRRLGVSLGVDLVPHKTCTLNCVYCECGKTTVLTDDIKEYVPTEKVIQELDTLLKGNLALDVITFSGSGEPTLHSGIGTIIDHIKSNYRYTIAVLTNGTLLWNREVRERLYHADIVIPSLDAATEHAFKKICRPHKHLSLQKIIDGIARFRKEFTGLLILEIFIVPGINDLPSELEALAKVARSIHPHRIQLNYLDRPGTEEWVQRASMETLEQYASVFAPLPVDIPGTPEYRLLELKLPLKEMILSTIERRPSTVDDLAYSLGKDKLVVQQILDDMVKQGVVEYFDEARGRFYKKI